ncbi:glutamate racemase [Shewanella sp. AS16]|uniref:glutamate racemase n=1 Tax=Shewanella sp. AS16 TaxID=2907625 RepID=UPI001F2A6AD3|nr:glutamate racemase [Shewanella sp. AS16]MCE9687826.1 glutamate racemase [Shewanella sp. AS16]
MSRPILVFDSGIGGLSVLQEIRKQLPGKDCCYLFDNARLPYGALEEQELIAGCVALVCELATHLNAAVVVIACNTASTLVLPALRQRLSMPIVGVVPAIKPAAQLSQSKHIGLLATPATVKRAYTHDLIRRFAHDCRVELFGSAELVLMAERKAARERLDPVELGRVLQPVAATEIDVLVLGCTHFPLLRTELQDYLGNKVTLLDSGEAIANRVSHLLPAEAALSGEGPLLQAFYTSEALTSGLTATLTAHGFTTIERLPPGSMSSSRAD